MTQTTYGFVIRYLSDADESPRPVRQVTAAGLLAEHDAVYAMQRAFDALDAQDACIIEAYPTVATDA